MLPPLYVSFYTFDYRHEAAGLVETLKSRGLPHEVVRLNPFPSWAAACQHKPIFIRDAMELYPGRPMVWLDADARVLQEPALFSSPLMGDFAAHWLGNELLSGTLYFGPTPAARALLETWIRRNRENPKGKYGDQRNLQDVVEAFPSALSLFRLPPEYAFVQAPDFAAGDDLSGKRYGPLSPVIRHLQASRRLKH
jgi:hypothetical protein